MKLSKAKSEVAATFDRNEALVLFELLQRLMDEKRFLPLLESSAEFAVLVRLGNHLEKTLEEPFFDNYEDLLHKARKEIIKYSGKYEGIEER